MNKLIINKAEPRVFIFVNTLTNETIEITAFNRKQAGERLSETVTDPVNWEIAGEQG